METARPDDQLQQLEQYEDVDPESLGYQGRGEDWIDRRRSAVQLPNEPWAAGVGC